MTRPELTALLPELDDGLLREIMLENFTTHHIGVAVLRMDREQLYAAIQALYTDEALATLTAEDFQEGFTI